MNRLGGLGRRSVVGVDQLGFTDLTVQNGEVPTVGVGVASQSIVCQICQRIPVIIATINTMRMV